MRTIFASLMIFLVAPVAGLSQEAEWTLVNGRAHLQTVITVPQRDAAFLYRQINRWMIEVFRNPEEVLKARVEQEYLKGEVYHANLLQLGASSAIDFRYTFSLEIKDEKVRLTLSNGVILYDDVIDTDGTYPIELYFKNLRKRSRDHHSKKRLAAVNALSASLLKSLQNYLLNPQDVQAAW